MKSDLQCCSECNERRKPYSRGTCRRCSSRRLNKNALRKIASEFKPASAYNDDIFKIYARIYEKLWIKNSDLPVAKKFALYLETRVIKEIKSWSDVYCLSDQAMIHYTSKKSQGCPFIRVGRELSKAGKIEHRKDIKIIRYRNLMEKFHLSLRSVMLEFYVEISVNHKTTSSSVKVLESVQVFCDFLDTNLIWKTTRADVDRFIESKLQEHGSAHYTERVRSLKRFFKWAQSKSFVSSNPFEGINHEKLIKKCDQCGRTSKFWTSNDLCDECYRDNNYRTNLVSLTAATTIYSRA